MANLKLDAQVRTITGTQVKKLRAEGLVPVVVYGRGTSPLNLQVSARNLAYVLQHGGTSRLVEVDVQSGGRHNILVRDVQRHPVNHHLMHADFYAVRMDEKQEVQVGVNSVGKPASLVGGLMVLQNHDMITIEALPADLPAVIEVDITNLSVEHPITVADLPALKGVRYVLDTHDHIFTMVAVQDNTADIPAAAAPAEPEVVKKAKQDADA
jgi:large subunit ribosomal protein L25